jgi:hypothetical protein
MEQKRSVRLVLRTSDLTFDGITTNGFCDEFGTNFTWYNINLRSLFGNDLIFILAFILIFILSYILFYFSIINFKFIYIFKKLFIFK